MTDAFYPTDPWPVLWSCDVSTTSPVVTGAALAFASNTLWALTGRQFGFTTVKFRPCNPGYRWDTPFPDNWTPWPGMIPQPVGSGWAYASYMWLGCTACAYGDCQHNSPADLRMPAPISAIIEVRVDGSPLVSGTQYRVDDDRYLVRTDGFTWPMSNNLYAADTEIGTWSVTAQFGQAVPPGAEIAVGQLACEYLRGLDGDDCHLPKNVTSLARQGVTITMPDPTTVFEGGLTGIQAVDLFIMTWNPKKLMQRARTYSVDTHILRRTDTAR